MQTVSITLPILYHLLYVKFASLPATKSKFLGFYILLYNNSFINKIIILDKFLERPGDAKGTVGSVILDMGQTNGFRLFQNVPNSDNVFGGLILIYAQSICCLSKQMWMNVVLLIFLTDAPTEHSKYIFLTIANTKVYLAKSFCYTLKNF